MHRPPHVRHDRSAITASHSPLHRQQTNISTAQEGVGVRDCPVQLSERVQLLLQKEKDCEFSVWKGWEPEDREGACNYFVSIIQRTGRIQLPCKRKERE